MNVGCHIYGTDVEISVKNTLNLGLTQGYGLEDRPDGAESKGVALCWKVLGTEGSNEETYELVYGTLGNAMWGREWGQSR